MSDDTPPSTAAALSRRLGPLRRSVLRATRAAADLPHLPDAHIELLRVIAEEPGLSPRSIADRVKLARPTVSNLLQTMRRAGLVALVRRDDDARRVEVTATAHALDLLARYDAASERILSTALDALTPAERRAVSAAVPALDRLEANLSSTDDA